MVVCRLLDPEGVELRKARRFKRRQYNNPVNQVISYVVLYIYSWRHA